MAKKKIWEHGEYPRLHVKWLEFEGPYFDQWPPEEHRQILFPSHLRGTGEGLCPQGARSFLSRHGAGRRTAGRCVDTPVFTEPGRNWIWKVLQGTLLMALVAPDFLPSGAGSG